MKNKINEIQTIMHYLGAAEFRKQLRTAAMNAAYEYEELNGKPKKEKENHALLSQILDEATLNYNGVYE